MHTIETTNGRVALVQAEVDQLIGWAEADAQHATENDARGTARDDRRRVKTLKRVRELLGQCLR